jgi:hypothetical protein
MHIDHVVDDAEPERPNRPVAKRRHETASRHVDPADDPDVAVPRRDGSAAIGEEVERSGACANRRLLNGIEIVSTANGPSSGPR